MAHERKAARLYLPRVTYSLPGAPDTPRREWRVSNGGRWQDSERPAAILPAPVALLLHLCAPARSIPGLGGLLSNRPTAGQRAASGDVVRRRPLPAPGGPPPYSRSSALLLQAYLGCSPSNRPAFSISAGFNLVRSSILVSSCLSYAQSHSNHVRCPTAHVFNSFVHYVSMCFDLKLCYVVYYYYACELNYV